MVTSQTRASAPWESSSSEEDLSISSGGGGGPCHVFGDGGGCAVTEDIAMMDDAG